MAVDPIPSHYPRLSPYLAAVDVDAAMAWYSDVLGFETRGGVMRMPDGRVGHAEMVLGESTLMMASEFPEVGNLAPTTVGGSPVSLHVYVADVDGTYAKAVAGGARSIREPEDQFYGDRSCGFVDPFGHRWSVASHVEDVDPEEMGRRMAEMGEL